MSTHPAKSMSILAPPYERLAELRIQGDSWRRTPIHQGSALVWLVDAEVEAVAGRTVSTRPGGLALIAVLPPASELVAVPSIWRIVGRCRPHAVLPHHGDPVVKDLSRLLRRPPDDLGSAVTDYIAWRGIGLDPDTVRLVRRTIELSSGLSSVSALARNLYLSRRALGRRFQSKGLPVPSHWLQFGRLLRLASALHNSHDPLSTVACSLGFPDGYSASNQMYRLLGLRPSVVRSRLGWEWLLEHWLRREAELGGFAPSETSIDQAVSFFRSQKAIERSALGART